MLEIYTSMEFRKFLSEDGVVWNNKVTYLWYANYADEINNKDWYKDPTDENRDIRRIKKIVENPITKITETFYPDAEPSKTYARSDRTTLNYI